MCDDWCTMNSLPLGLTTQSNENCDGDPCMECHQACLLRQSGLLGYCMAATLGQRKVHVLLLRTGMLIYISTASLCSFLETIGDAGEHVGQSNAAPSNGSKTLTTPRQVPFLASLVSFIPSFLKHVLF
jgi:hypothetical protein